MEGGAEGANFVFKEEGSLGGEGSAVDVESARGGDELSNERRGQACVWV